MSYLITEEYTKEDCIRAKRVCEGTSTDLAFFNVFFKKLKAYIGERFLIRDDPSENPYDAENKVEIIRKYKIMMYVDSVMTELSIDEYILISLKKWVPETASYFTYIYDQLVNWHARVPVRRTVEQMVHRSQLKAMVEVIKSSNPEINFSNCSSEEILQLLGQYLPPEYSDKLRYLVSIYMPNQSLDMRISEDDKDSDTYLDMLKSDYPSDEEIPLQKTNPFLIVEAAYKNFIDAKLVPSMTQRIRLYATVELIQDTISYLSFDDYRELATRYPDFITDVDWIEKIYNENTKEHPDFEVSTRMPTQIQQAERLKVDYHSYCNSILRYKKKISKDDSSVCTR